MNYFEEKFSFEEVNTVKRTTGFHKKKMGNIQQMLIIREDAPKVLGIAVRLGNEPIVKNIKKLYEYSAKTIPPDLQVLFEKKDIYLIVHSISAIRLSGSAKVDELQYKAEIVEKGTQTIDLLPNTSFKELASINMGFEGSISGNGNFSATIPFALSQSLLQDEISLGGDIKIQLSTNASFVGKFTYSLKFPIIQSAGIASNFCQWVLNPQDNPLLGDQLLIQTVAVPKGTEKITYKTKGVCKADRGIFWKQQIMETSDYKVEINLL